MSAIVSYTKDGGMEVVRSVAEQVIGDEAREGIREHAEAAADYRLTVAEGLPVNSDPRHYSD